MVLAVLPFAIWAAGGSDGQFGVALAVEALAMIFLLLPSGVIGDRFNRRSVVITADLMRFGARGAFVALLVVGHAEYWQLLIAQAVNGAGTALFNTTMDGFVPEVFGEDSQLQKINALRVFALSIGLLLGPVIGGLLYSIAGTTVVFAADATTFLVSSVLIYLLPTPFATSTLTPATFLAVVTDLKEGWSAFRRISWYWRIATEFAILNGFVFAPYFVIGPHVAAESLGGSSAWVAILVGLGAGELIGSIVAMAWVPRRPLLFATLAVMAWVVPLLLLATLAPVALLCASAVLAGISTAIFMAIWETVKQTHTPPHLRARLGSFDHIGSLGPVPLGYIFGGLELAVFGASVALITAALILISATLSVSADPNIRGLVTLGDKDITGIRGIPDVALLS